MENSNLTDEFNPKLTSGSSFSTHTQISSRSHKISALSPSLLLKAKDKVVTGFYADNLLTTHEDQNFEAQKLYYNRCSNLSISSKDVEINFLECEQHQKDQNQLKQFLKKFLNSLLNGSCLQNVILRIPYYLMKNFYAILSVDSLKNFDKVKGLSIDFDSSFIEKIDFKHLLSLEKLKVTSTTRFIVQPNRESLFASISRLTQLKEIELSCLDLEFKINSLTSILRKNSKLQSIRFSFKEIEICVFSLKQFQEAIQELNSLKILSLHIKSFFSYQDDKEFSDVKIFNQLVQSLSKHNLECLDLDLPHVSLASSESQTKRFNTKGLLSSATIRTLTLNLIPLSIQESLLDYMNSSIEFFSTGIKNFTLNINPKFNSLINTQTPKDEYQKAFSIIQWMSNLKSLTIRSNIFSLSLETIAKQIKSLKYLTSLELDNNFSDAHEEDLNPSFSLLLNSLQELSGLSSLKLNMGQLELSSENVELVSNCLKNLEELAVCRLQLDHQDYSLLAAKVIESFTIRPNKLKNFELIAPINLYLGDNLLNTISNFLSKSSLLENLKLSHILFSAGNQKEDFIKLYQSISTLKKLKELYVGFGKESINRTYSNFAKFVDTICNLENLNNVNLIFKDIEDLSDLFFSLGSKSKKLKHIKSLIIMIDCVKINFEEALMYFVYNMQFSSKCFICKLTIYTEEENDLDEFCRDILINNPNLMISCIFNQ